MNFLEQLQALREKQPRICILNARSENSDYSPYGGQNMNCYLCYGNGGNWDCFYIYWPYKNEDCCDGSYLYECKLCYECVSCTKCYNCNYCQDCVDTYDSWFCYDCVGCSNCVGCVGLRRARYHIFNKPYSKEEYEKKMAEYDFHDFETLRKIQTLFEELQLKVPRLYSHQLNNENCTGDYIYNSCNCYSCWDATHCWDCGYDNNLENSKDTWDSCFGGALPCELCYECMSLIDLYDSNFCNTCWYSGNLEYCELCFNCRDCFGCVSLNGKQFHILNKPYSKEEYFEKVAEIKEEMRREGIYGKHLESDYDEFLARVQ